MMFFTFELSAAKDFVSVWLQIEQIYFIYQLNFR